MRSEAADQSTKQCRLILTQKCVNLINEHLAFLSFDFIDKISTMLAQKRSKPAARSRDSAFETVDDDYEGLARPKHSKPSIPRKNGLSKRKKRRLAIGAAGKLNDPGITKQSVQISRQHTGRSVVAYNPSGTTMFAAEANTAVESAASSSRGGAQAGNCKQRWKGSTTLDNNQPSEQQRRRYHSHQTWKLVSIVFF